MQAQTCDNLSLLHRLVIISVLDPYSITALRTRAASKGHTSDLELS